MVSDTIETRMGVESARCPECEGLGTLPEDCPHRSRGCLIDHRRGCRKCSGSGLVGKNLEVRIVRNDDGRVTIRGYAAVFDSWSPEYDGFSEIIRPGAFTDTLSSKKSDVRALFNHNPDRPLGRVRAGTMTLRADNRGLLYEIDAPESASDVVEAIERRDVTGSSFSFTVRKQGEAWEYDEKGRAKRELLSVNLLDVGPVTFPFYPQTSAAVRSLDRFRREHPELCPMDWRRLELAERGI